jgi:hypothetical protein
MDLRGRWRRVCTFDQVAKGIVAEPEPGADRALEDGQPGDAEIATREVAVGSTGGTDLRGRLAGSPLGIESCGAVVAVACPVGDSSGAPRADGVEVTLVHGEIRAAVVTRGRGGDAGGAARRTSNHLCFVGLRPRNRQGVAAETAESVARVAAGGIVLAFTGRAGDQKAHHFIQLYEPGWWIIQKM